MKTIGLTLFFVAFLAFAGSFAWALFTETDEAPWVVWVIFGSLISGLHPPPDRGHTRPFESQRKVKII